MREKLVRNSNFKLLWPVNSRHALSTPKTEWEIYQKLMSWLLKESDFQYVTLWISKFFFMEENSQIYPVIPKCLTLLQTFFLKPEGSAKDLFEVNINGAVTSYICVFTI